MIPRLQGKIAGAFPSSPPGLAFSEYNSGCEMSIAGGIAEADDLGVFGREGVFAAAAMPGKPVAGNYLVAAFDLYRNYDGNGAVVGDTAVGASSSDSATTSVYAFSHSGNASQIDVVAINKRNDSAMAHVQIAHAPALSSAKVFQLVDGSTAVGPGAMTSVTCSGGSCAVDYLMPPLSAVTIALK
jgi:mannan endo-1,4-beta-mannosidase